MKIAFRSIIASNMNLTSNKAFKEVISLLYWSMLAACTVGPGTVVTCARAGYEQGLSLLWALLFATAMAFTLQEGAARLTLSSGKSLGECLRIKYRHLPKFYNVSILCWIVSTCVYLGNTLYQCNNWAGGMSAIYSMPGAENTNAIRISCCIGYAIVVYGLLYLDKTHHLSVGLGVAMLGMVTLFLVTVIKLGLDWDRFWRGLIPNFPDGSSSLILSLVGTTSIGFNLFLGSSMAADSSQNISSAQRGIAFSVCGALAISVLITIVGDGVTGEQGESFDLDNLADLIEETIGVVGLVFFSLGFIAAAVSSMISVPLGAALTADSMFTIKNGSPEDVLEVVEEGEDKKEVLVEKEQTMPRWIYQGIMLSIILVATIVISANMPTEEVVQVAQVFNGILLPFFSTCLLLCLNDQTFMKKMPQKWWANIFLLFAVTVTLFLACNVIIQNIFGSLVENEAVKLGIAGGLAPVIMLIVIFGTSLKTGLRKSFQCSHSN